MHIILWKGIPNTVDHNSQCIETYYWPRTMKPRSVKLRKALLPYIKTTFLRVLPWRDQKQHINLIHILPIVSQFSNFFPRRESLLLSYYFLIQNLELILLKSQKLEQLDWSKAHIHTMCNYATLTKRLGT